jgi:acetyltransferase-like isoleucine patch superfamily enzyme
MFVLLRALPGRTRRVLFKAMLGWDIDETARMGLCWLDVGELYVGANTQIGHFNVFRNIVSARFADNVNVGQWNWITAATPFLRTGDLGCRGCLSVGRDSGISSRHYIDCSGGVEIGEFTTIAGVRQTILTHEISAQESYQTVRPVKVGAYCLVSSNVLITPGSVIPDRSLIAMGAVITGVLETPGMLWGGIPARALKFVGAGKYFSRQIGFVWPRESYLDSPNESAENHPNQRIGPI